MLPNGKPGDDWFRCNELRSVGCTVLQNCALDGRAAGATLSYFVTHRMGWDDADPPLSTLHDLLDELSEHEDDVEHGSVAVTHESGAALEVGRGGHVVFTPDLEADAIEQFHVPPGTLDRGALIDAMRSLAGGRLNDLRALPWKPGNQ